MVSPLEFFRVSEQADQFSRSKDKFRELIGAGADPNVLKPFMLADIRRIQGGQQPMSARETAVMTAGALQGRTTPEPKQGFFSRIAGDLRGLASMPIHLPGALLEEAKHVPEAIEALPKALGAGGPKQIISSLSGAPVWRMLPGAFVAHSATTPGQMGELAKHPIFTLLDVLPYASQAAKLTAPGRAAALAGKSPLVGLGKAVELAGEAKLGGRPAVAARAGTGARPAVVGQAEITGWNPKLRRFMPSELWKRMPFGGDVRDLTRVIEPRGRMVSQAVANYEAKVNKALNAFEIPEARQVELWHGAQSKATPEFWDSVTDHEMAYLRKAQEFQRPWEQLGLRLGELMEWKGELYSQEQAPRLFKLVKKYQIAKDHLAKEASHAAIVEATKAETFKPWKGPEETGFDPANPLTALPEAPPVKRLYRGIKTDGEGNLGWWWTEDAKAARGYAGTKGKVYYLDLTPDEAARATASVMGPGTYDLSPHLGADELSRRAAQVTRGKPPPPLAARKPHPYEDVTRVVPRRLLEPFREFDRALPGEKLKPGQKAVPAGQEPYLKALEADIAATGIRDPIILDYNPDNGYAYISEGNHRLAVARKLGIKEVPVRVMVARLAHADTPGAKFIGKDLIKANEHGYRPTHVSPDLVLGERVARQVTGRPRRPPGAPETYWSEQTARIEAQLAAAESRTLPARAVPLMAEKMREHITSIVRDGGTDADFAATMDYAQGGFYGQIPGMSVQLRNSLAKDARKMWLDLKEQGYNPMWFHQVGEKAVRELRFPRIIPERDITPGQLRRRGLDMTPSRPSFALSISHQGAEWMIRNHSSRAWDAMVERGIVRPAEEIQKLAVDQARRELGLKGADLSIEASQEFRARVDHIKRRDFDIVDPESIFPIRPSGLQAAPGMYEAPKAVAKAIELIREPPGAVLRATAKPMKLFRASVLFYSPQYYINNVIGDSIMLLAREGPMAFKHLPDAVRMLKARKVPGSLARGLQDMPPEYRAWDYAAGRKVADLLPTQKLMHAAEWINDTGRVTAYLRGMEKAVAKGAKRGEAHLAGLETANRVFQNWDTMTPIERTAVRAVIPFYSFTRYVLRYVMTLPFDHPIRVSIVSNLARTELEDWRKGGMSDDLLNILFLGRPDKQGNVKGISTRGLNPFYDVASAATFAGWVSKVNPIIGGVLKTVGFDPQRGPELYPELVYDHATGRLKVAGGSMFDVAAGFVPQFRTAAGLLGMTKDIRQLRDRDPEAFRRLLLSGARISSFVPTGYNLYERKGRAELTRYEQFRAALVALKKGKAEPAMAYPELAEVVRRLSTDAQRPTPQS